MGPKATQGRWESLMCSCVAHRNGQPGHTVHCEKALWATIPINHSDTRVCNISVLHHRDPHTSGESQNWFGSMASGFELEGS